MWKMELIDKKTGKISKPVPFQDVIFNQNDIEFEWGEFGDDNYDTLPYKDFLFFKDDYDILIDFGGK